jgi:hypothetical protein
MNHRDKFPPNDFLLRTIMKTPEHFLLFIVILLLFVVIGMVFFPTQLGIISLFALMIWCPFMVIMLVWNIVWNIRNPPPKDDHE